MNSPILSRCLHAIALMTWGVVLVYFYLSDRLTKYLAPEFLPISFAGGLAMIVIGLFILLTARQPTECGHDHGPEDTHDHESLDIHPIGAALIMIVPLLLSTAWTQDRFSEATLNRKGLQDSPSRARSLVTGLQPLTREIIERQHPKNENGYRPFPLMELFFTSAEPETRALVEGMSVVTEGRMVIDSGKPHTRRRLYRLFVTCCAADSRPIPIIAEFTKLKPPDIEENTWMTLSGTISFPDEGDGPIPVIRVEFAEQTEAPFQESFMRGY
mgnify:CR=1 FL=1